MEATLFATLMSILNGGAFVGSALGSGLTAAFGVTATDFTHLVPLILVCSHFHAGACNALVAFIRGEMGPRQLMCTF